VPHSSSGLGTWDFHSEPATLITLKWSGQCDLDSGRVFFLVLVFFCSAKWAVVVVVVADQEDRFTVFRFLVCVDLAQSFHG